VTRVLAGIGGRVCKVGYSQSRIMPMWIMAR
jgi:hypothetical protein